MPKFSDRSKQHLLTCKDPLIELFTEVIKERDCSVLCGYRNKQDQDIAFAKGYSKVRFPNSKHNQNPSDAIDVMPYPIDWNDRLGQHEFAAYVYNKAMMMNIRVKWGGQFKTLYDAPHWELINA